MRVLLTGGSGFVGRHVIPALQARGFEVHGLSSRRESSVADGVAWHHADLFDERRVTAVVRSVRPSHMLHLAWFVEPSKFWTSEENLRWVGASLNLIRAFVAAGGTRMTIAGTCAEYRWGSATELDEATTPLDPATLYGTAKNTLHLLAARVAAEHRAELAWARLFFLYGPHEPRARLVPSIVTPLLRGEVARCTSGHVERDFLHVSDAGDGLAAVLDSGLTGAVNVASGSAIRVRDLIEVIGRACGRQDLLAFGALPDRKGDPLRLVASVDRLRQEVAWRPQLTIDAGVQQTVQWWRQRLAEQCVGGR